MIIVKKSNNNISDVEVKLIIMKLKFMNDIKLIKPFLIVTILAFNLGIRCAFFSLFCFQN